MPITPPSAPSGTQAIVLQARNTTNWRDLYDTPVVSAACKARIGGVSFYVNKLTFIKASTHTSKTSLLQVLLHLRRRLLQGRQKQQPALGSDLTIRPYQQDHGQRQPGPRPVLSACTRAAPPLRPEPTGLLVSPSRLPIVPDAASAPLLDALDHLCTQVDDDPEFARIFYAITTPDQMVDLAVECGILIDADDFRALLRSGSTERWLVRGEDSSNPIMHLQQVFAIATWPDQPQDDCSPG